MRGLAEELLAGEGRPTDLLVEPLYARRSGELGQALAPQAFHQVTAVRRRGVAGEAKANLQRGSVAQHRVIYGLIPCAVDASGPVHHLSKARLAQ